MQLVLPRPAPLLRARTEATTEATADDEAQLVARARVGEVAALDALMNRHRARLLNLAFQITRDRDLAEDCAQEAFVRAFSGLHSFRAQSSFGTWLYRIALNVALEKNRRTAPIGDALVEGSAEICGDKSEVSAAPREQTSALSLDEIAAPPRDVDAKLALEWALDQLSPPLRIALILREWHGLTYEEMASACAVPVGTIRSRLSAARADFRRLWNEMEAE